MFERLAPIALVAPIALGRVADFSLEEIASMLGGDGKPRVDRAHLREREDELGAKIVRPRATRRPASSADCPAGSH